MTEARQPQTRRLHPLSFVFALGGLIRSLAAPVLAFAVLGRSVDRIHLIGMLLLAGATLWALLRTRAYSYELGPGELLVREGLLDRTQRHIPFARIHNISQRRMLLHRLLGVTELRLESASGAKPEAVMRVLGVEAARSLEQILRGQQPEEQPEEHREGSAEPATGSAGEAAPPSISDTPSVLHALSSGEILRLGLTSNRGLLVVVIALGTAFQQEFLRRQFAAWMGVSGLWLRNQLFQQVQGQRWQGALLELMLAGLLLFVLLRLLSVVLAFVRYHGFRLEQHGEQLIAVHGLLTQVRAGARLPRLQRWQIDETWWHRRFGRCRLGVAVAGSMHGSGSHGAEPGVQFKELAPIARWQQAQALLKVCLPTLDWPALQWQPLHAVFARRLWRQARWALPLAFGLLACSAVGLIALSVPAALAVVLLLGGAWLAYLRLWARFAAYAVAGDVVLYRSGLWHRRWVIVAMPRLQSLRLYSTPLDRRLGVRSLQADTQGGSKSHRALDIPCLKQEIAQGLRTQAWQAMQRAP